MPKKCNSKTQILDARRDRQNMEALAKSCTAKEATIYNANSIMQKASKNFTHVRPATPSDTHWVESHLVNIKRTGTAALHKVSYNMYINPTILAPPRLSSASAHTPVSNCRCI